MSDNMSPRILLLTHRVPYPPDKGDRIRSFRLLRYLAARARVHLGFLTDEAVPESTGQMLNSLCEHVVVGNIPRWQRLGRGCMSLLAGKSITEGWFYSPAFQSEIDRLIANHQYDAIVCSSSSTLQYVQGHNLENRIVSDLIDVDSEKWRDYSRRSKPPLSWVFRAEHERVRWIEREAAANHAVVVSTEREAALYREIAVHANIQVINNGIDLEYFTPQEGDEQQGCIFVGYLDYRANVLGLQWFCREVWPELIRQHPHATFKIVGRNPTRAVRRLQATPGVEVVGPVADVRPLLARTSLVVVPLPVARGVQNKILEAMSMRKAVVASHAAAAGIGAQIGRELVTAETAAEWVREISSLWTDSSRRREIGKQARLYVEAHHDWDRCLAPLGQICDSLQSPRRPKHVVMREPFAAVPERSFR